MERAHRERLALLVHEVRSPVAALAAIAEALAGDSLDADAVRDLLRLAVAACRGIERVVEDAAVGTVELVDVDLRELARDAAAAARLGGARVRESGAPDVPVVLGDPLRLRQALDNLISNAVAYSPPEEDVVVAVGLDASEVALSVADKGAGIPVAEQARIFAPGVRLDTDRPGSGLGLAIARAIAEAHGGRLTVESAPGEGSTFTLVLPVPRR